MPAQQPKSASLAALAGKLKAGHKKALAAPVKMPLMDPPPGIDHGIAQLVDARFGVYASGANKGKHFFLAAGVIKSPKSYGGMKTEGMRVQLMEELCETKTKKGVVTSFDEHLVNVYGHIKNLGGEDLLNQAEDISEELEGIVATLKEMAPHFRFRTRAGKTSAEYPNPRTWIDWCGVCDEPISDGDADVVDESGEAPVDEEVPADEEASAEEAAADEPATDEGPDLDALAEAADGGDEDAIATLTEVVEQTEGIDKKNVEKSKDWASVVAMIRELQPADEEATAEEEAEPEAEAEPEEPEEEVPADPAKEEVYSYQQSAPVDPKTKKPKKGAKLQVEVVAVYKKSKTVDLKNLADDKVIKGVAWDKLLPPA